jgi:hypothetical protein
MAWGKAARSITTEARGVSPEATMIIGILSASLAVCLFASQPASSAPEKLEKRLLGKQLLSFDGTVKEGDPGDATTHFPGTTYFNCRDTYTYFVEPIPDEWRQGPISGYVGPLKYQKVFHGLRVVYDDKGQLYRIENYYAGVPHGLWVVFENGKRWYEITYQYGLRHGISRHYTRDGKLLLEEEYRDEKRVCVRSFHENGQPARWLVSGVVRDDRDQAGKPILNK